MDRNYDLCRINSMGDTEYTLEGVTHRLDGPAIITPERTEIWYKNGKVHRDNGPAKIWTDGTYIGCQEYFKFGQLHRSDGPAIIGNNNVNAYWNYPRWWINGHKVDEEKYCKWMIDMNIDINNISEYEEPLIIMVWGNGSHE